MHPFTRLLVPLFYHWVFVFPLYSFFFAVFPLGWFRSPFGLSVSMCFRSTSLDSFFFVVAFLGDVRVGDTNTQSKRESSLQGLTVGNIWRPPCFIHLLWSATRVVLCGAPDTFGLWRSPPTSSVDEATPFVGFDAIKPQRTPFKFFVFLTARCDYTNYTRDMVNQCSAKTW